MPFFLQLLFEIQIASHSSHILQLPELKVTIEADSANDIIISGENGVLCYYLTQNPEFLNCESLLNEEILPKQSFSILANLLVEPDLSVERA